MVYYYKNKHKEYLMFTIPEKYKILSGSTLKTIAIVSMFIDHAALVLLYWGILYHNQPITEGTKLYTIYLIYEVMRKIGRIAFPIFCFLLIEGFIHTSNRKKYALRLLIFAVISEIPFNLAAQNQWLDSSSCNVFVTLLLGLLTIWAMDHFREKYYMQIPIALLGCLIAYLVNSDYDYRGIILIVLLYIFRYNRSMQAISGSIALYWEWQAIFAFIPICMYNGKRGRNIKYFFYVFYPAHLLLLYLIGQIIF